MNLNFATFQPFFGMSEPDGLYEAAHPIPTIEIQQMGRPDG
jgi:hypothetical protein